jgi:hypothetical protein
MQPRTGHSAQPGGLPRSGALHVTSQETQPAGGPAVPSPRPGDQVWPGGFAQIGSGQGGSAPGGGSGQGGSAPGGGSGQGGPGQNGTEQNGTGHSGGGRNGTAGDQPERAAARRLGAPVPRAPEPSWGTVIANTVRLWAQRRRLWPRRARWRVAAVAALLAVVFAAGAATIALSGSGGVGSHAGGRPAGAARAAAGGPAALAAAAAARQQAAVWLAGQVSADAIVACDPAMCGALQAQHLPAGRLLVLGSGKADPLGSDLVVATPAVRSQYGTRLAGVYAPVTLASFGAGSVRIDVRVVAPDGAAAYHAALAADVRARKAVGGQLLRNRHIHLQPAARAAVAGGEVDSRLLVTLAALSFGGPDHGASAGVPLRLADIAGASARGARHPASLHSLRAFLSAQRPPYLPASVTAAQITARRVGLRIEYGLPSPLGLLGSRS